MDTLTTLINIALIWTIAAVTPGPNFVLTAQTATGYSRRQGLAAVSGIFTGTLICGLAGLFGIGAPHAGKCWLVVALKIDATQRIRL